VIDVQEPRETASGWAERARFGFPVLLDGDGRAAESYAPAGLLPDLPRSQVPIASNLIIDRDGKIRFYTLLDSANFDARLVALRAKLDELLAAEGSGAPRPPVVSVRADPVEIRPGHRADARLEVTVAEGFHVQANPASEPYLIALRLELGDVPGLKTGAPVYPPGKAHRLRGASSDLSTYEGTLGIRVPLEAAPELPTGETALEGRLHYQACDARVCLRPSSVSFRLRVDVGGSVQPRGDTPQRR
jgi:hypothetical protein